MRPEPETITLGEKSWLIRPLTLRQVQELEPVAASLSRGETSQVESFVKMLAAALRRDHAGEIEGLLDVEAGIEEIKTALAAIMRLSGLVAARDSPRGEGVAAPAASQPGEAPTGA